MQADLHLVVTGGLHGAGQLEPALVQVRTTGALDGFGDLGRGDRAVETTARAGAYGNLHRERLETGLHLVGVAQVADLASPAGALDDRDLLFRAAAPRDREPLRKQVVAPVAALDLDNVAGGTETGDLLGEDDLHLDLLSEPWSCRAAAPSRGHS